MLVGFRRWAKRLDERHIDKGADAYRKGRVPSLQVRLIAAAVVVAISLLLLYVLPLPSVLLTLAVPLAVLLLLELWRRTRL